MDNVYGIPSAVRVGRDSDWLRGWTVQGSNPGGGKIYRTIPNRPSLLYNGYRFSLRRVKRPVSSKVMNGCNNTPYPHVYLNIVDGNLYLRFCNSYA